MSNPILTIEKNGFQWKTEDPFIITMHHKDAYPKGNEHLGPAESLDGRHIGNDFSGLNGYSMYHGQKVPGFPVHPHRGFETVTIVLEGYVDHFDSLGASGRYGEGDVQWLTTGAGCQHVEMFPLLNTDKGNPLELFQIWLNLPSFNKFVDPDYKMLWHEQIPKIEERDGKGNRTFLTLLAGSYDGYKAVDPAKDSWAKDPKNHVRLLLIRMEPYASWTLLGVNETINRNLYYYRGSNTIEISGQAIASSSRIKVGGAKTIEIQNGKAEAFILLMEGEPINEPVVAYGPFVMNTTEEIKQAAEDYYKTQFGGWPWPSHEPVFDRQQTRIAKYADCHEDKP